MELTKDEIDRYCELYAKISQKAREIIRTFGDRFKDANRKFDENTRYILTAHNPIAAIAEPLFLKTSDELKDLNWKLAEEKRESDDRKKKEREAYEKEKRRQEYLELKKEFDKEGNDD